MKRIEDELRGMRLAEPSVALDGHIERALDEAAAGPRSLFGRPVAVWQCAAACLVSLAFGFLLNHYVASTRPAPAEVVRTVYYVPMENEMRAVRAPKPKPQGFLDGSNPIQVRIVEPEENI